jgi:hypothetical protein
VSTLGALLAERRLIGRDAELEALRAAPPIAVVHGVAGSGKSALLRAFARECDDVTWVDGRAIEPTPQGFLAAAGDAPALLFVDTAERLRLLEGWLRNTYLPSLPATSRVVIATQQPPGAVWRAAFGELMRTLALGPLSPADAAELLHSQGLDAEQAERANRFARGHPLSLLLAASATELPTVAEELAALYLDGLDDATREALDATCILRRVTLSLLGALVEDPAEAFARLHALPFVELGREGLVVHDSVREAVSALLRASDPVRHRAYRTAAWRQIRAELPRGGWASVADMIALVEEPLVREAFFPTSVQHYAVETARADDWEAIEAITTRHVPEQDMRPWWEAVPHAFRVARNSRGRVVAYTILCPLEDVPRALVLDAWREHLRAHPVPRGERVLLARMALAWGTGAAPSPCFSALLRDVERASLETPAVRRIYTVTGRENQLEPLGYVPLGGDACVCDLGPESVPGWLSMLAARGLDIQRPTLGDRELILDGERIALTKLETDVLRYLTDRAGQPVSRQALLRDVWGYEWDGGANAVDVAISALRRKLGAHAGSLATVRGVGFRFTGWSAGN